MTPRKFLSDRLGRLLLQIVSIATMCIFLYATGTKRDVLAIILIAWFLGLVLLQLIDFFKLHAHISELDAIMDHLDQKHLFSTCVPTPQSAYERKLFSLLYRSGKAMIEAVSDAHAAQRAYREYIESWVHEIKTPITAAQLISQSVDSEIRRKLLYELSQIDNHVERALFYARAESPERDFIIRQIDLSTIVTQTIAHYQTFLIQNSAHIETANLTCTVYTDSKWVCFMLGQFLQNAVRYRGESLLISIAARQLGSQVQLTIQDNGIGIPLHELSRVFERGFTGSNGRARGGATGMGLYLCRQLAGFLGIDLQVKSKEGYGTSIIMTFPSKDNLTKM